MKLLKAIGMSLIASGVVFIMIKEIEILINLCNGGRIAELLFILFVFFVFTVFFLEIQ